MTRFIATLAASTILATAPGLALQDSDDAEWDVAHPPLPTRSIPIEVSEGTWMSLDVSPDGQTIAFDLLGDIYTMPVGGGAATNIASGLPWEYQPRFSPDGSRIAFTSDRGGGDNVWIMNTDGSDARQLTEESFRLLNNPTWHPSGRYIAARSRAPVLRFVRGLGDESGGDIMDGGRYTEMLLPFLIGKFKARFYTFSTAL